MDRLISEQAVIDTIYESHNNFKNEFDQGFFVDKIRALSSVKQEPKTGHWFIDERPESNREVICSNCEQTVFKYHKLDFDYRPKYCPNCGAKMLEPQESDHTCHTCKHYTSGERDGSCGSYICHGYSNWESEE